MNPALTCREFVEFLDDYIAGELSPEEQTHFDRHVSSCPSCVAYMKSYQASIALAREALLAEDDDLPGDIPEDLIRAILAARPAGGE